VNTAVVHRPLWQYGLWSFQTGGTKLERFLHENQHTQRKLLIFENWINHRQENRHLVGHFYDMKNQFWAVGCGLGWAVE
jgi:hypothetical protein